MRLSRRDSPVAGRDLAVSPVVASASVYRGCMEHDPEVDEELDAAIEDMQSDVDEMEQRSQTLGDHIDETSSAWRSKQQDDSVPGAEPPVDDEAEPPPSTSS
jgi:hypothetical protein